MLVEEDALLQLRDAVLRELVADEVPGEALERAQVELVGLDGDAVADQPQLEVERDLVAAHLHGGGWRRAESRSRGRGGGRCGGGRRRGAGASERTPEKTEKTTSEKTHIKSSLRVELEEADTQLELKSLSNAVVVPSMAFEFAVLVKDQNQKTLIYIIGIFKSST